MTVYSGTEAGSTSVREKDGVVRRLDKRNGYTIYIYSRRMSDSVEHAAVVLLDNLDTSKRHSALVVLYTI
jgi:hypothetical protein